MSRRRKLQLLIPLILLLTTSLVLYLLLSPTRIRRTWTGQAVAEITALSSDPTLIPRETAAIATQPSMVAPQTPWVGEHVALMRNGQWIVFKNECVHRHQLLGDVFIAKASDSHWYHSTFHFCCEMLVTQMDPQPPDLQTFITHYSLRPFDGNPDSPDAIEPTCTPGSSPIH